MMTDESNKGYKFKFEVEDIIYFDGDHRPQNKCRFTLFGDSVKEVIDNYDQLVDEWHRHIHKEMKGPLNNKKELT